MNLGTFFQIIIVLFCLLVLCVSSGICPPASFDFDYVVDGQTILLRPSVNAAYDEYRWRIFGNNGIESDTNWIPVDDLYNHMTTHDNGTTYLVQLHVRCSTGSWMKAEYIRIGSNGTRTMETVGASGDESQFINALPSWLTSLHPLVWVIVFCVIIGGSISFLVWDDRVVIYRRIKTK